MKGEPTEEDIQAFDKLVPKADELHPNAWCVRQQMVIMTRDLKGRICLNCSEFVMQEGICDPL